MDSPFEASRPVHVRSGDPVGHRLGPPVEMADNQYFGLHSFKYTLQVVARVAFWQQKDFRVQSRKVLLDKIGRARIRLAKEIFGERGFPKSAAPRLPLVG